MAAPTLGAVMADILPYLGVEKRFSPEDPAGAETEVEDVCGLTAEDAARKLKASGLTARNLGSGETVTGQIPAPGERIPAGSQVLLYLREEPEERMVSVPDFTGMHRQQAAEAAGELGLYVLAAGNEEISPQVVVTAQNSEANTQVPRGTTIILTFTDITARD